MLGRAFILEKIDAGTDTTEERYACLVPTVGGGLCECRGFVYAGHCKHLAALTELVTAGRV